MHAAATALVALIAKVQLTGRTASKSSGRADRRPTRPKATSRANALFSRQAPAAAVSPATEAWMAPLGNACAVGSLLLCQVINIGFLDGTRRGMIPTSPLLLLLSPQRLFLSRLASSTSTRYTPLAVALACTFSAAALMEAYDASNLSAFLVSSLWQYALALAPLPSLVLWCSSLWMPRAQPTLPTLCVLPLNLLPLMLAFAPAVRENGILGLLAGCLGLYSAQRSRSIGQKVI